MCMRVCLLHVCVSDHWLSFKRTKRLINSTCTQSGTLDRFHTYTDFHFAQTHTQHTSTDFYTHLHKHSHTCTHTYTSKQRHTCKNAHTSTCSLCVQAGLLVEENYCISKSFNFRCYLSPLIVFRQTDPVLLLF